MKNLIQPSLLCSGVATRLLPRSCKAFSKQPVRTGGDASLRQASVRRLSGVDFDLLNVAAADFDGEMRMQTSSVRDGEGITHAHLTEQSEGENLRTVPVRKLDSIVSERAPEKPYLLKIDVDGVEMKILAGAEEMLSDCSVVVIEAGPKNFMERAGYVVSRGFELFDFVDLCYYDDILRQFDLVFLSKRIIAEHGLDMYKQPFDINKWVQYG